MDEVVETSKGCDDHGEHESKETAPGSDLFSDSVEDECCGSSLSLETCSSEETLDSGATRADSSTEQPPPAGWPLKKSSIVASGLVMQEDEDDGKACDEQDDAEIDKLKPTKYSEIEMMKERFSKLLLGEDMSGCGKGVCTALAISNAITNLCATIFGQLWRLEPLPSEKKSMWRREMEWLLCVSDHIVEMIPSWQTFPDGTKLEVMTCRPRSDIYINLPALKKLDNMLLEILDSFSDTEFWYVDQGIVAADSDGGSASFRTFHRQEEKWWLPVPRVPQGGLHEKTRKELQHKRECTGQILKAAMAINSNTLAEMEVPEAYLASLPKNGRTSLGDLMYRYVTSDQFAPECLLDCLDLSSDHQALEIANRVEASIYTWRRRTSASSRTSNSSKSSWEIVKDMIVDAADNKRELLVDRAETLLLCLKQRFPSLTQTSLDTSKIQFNKDIGKSILESYSRVLESLAFNIVARIDDLLQVDDFCKHSDHPSAVPTVGLVAQNKAFAVPVSGTPLISPARRERSPLLGNSGRKHSGRGFGMKKVLTSYLSNDQRSKNPSCDAAATDVIPSRNSGVLPS